MKRFILAVCIVLLFAPAGAQAGFMDVLNAAAENVKVPKDLIGTWVYTGSMNQTLTISDKDFTLEVYNRDGKLWQTYSGPMRNVDNSKKFLGPALSTLMQDGASMEHLLKKGGPYHKLIYYKDLTADGAKFYIHNGYAAEKNLRDHDEDSKTDSNYQPFVRKK